MTQPTKQAGIKLGLKQLTQRSGGLAAWSIRHPVGVSMIALAVDMFMLHGLVKMLQTFILSKQLFLKILA